jgi:hypothetical protein
MSERAARGLPKAKRRALARLRFLASNVMQLGCLGRDETFPRLWKRHPS